MYFLISDHLAVTCAASLVLAFPEVQDALDNTHETTASLLKQTADKVAALERTVSSG